MCILGEGLQVKVFAAPALGEAESGSELGTAGGGSKAQGGGPGP